MVMLTILTSSLGSSRYEEEDVVDGDVLEDVEDGLDAIDVVNLLKKL